jgi:hypothetical protein
MLDRIGKMQLNSVQEIGCDTMRLQEGKISSRKKEEKNETMGSFGNQY